MDPFLGEVILFAGNFAPRGWAFCDGQLLSIAQYSALFSLLGTIYGGDGRTSFALPDLRGRTPIHAGNGPGLSNRHLGSKGGQETVTLTINQIPAHSHRINAVSSAGNDASPLNNLLANTVGLDREYSNSSPDVQMNSYMVNNSGGGQSHANMQPFLSINYIIALQGIFPSRS